MHNRKFPNVRAPFRFLIPAALAVALLCPALAEASIIISIQNVNANSPSSGNAFDVLLTNTGAGSVALGAFSFELTTADADITFFSATTATTLAPYVFGSNSLFGPIISTSAPGQTMDASDIFSTPNSGTTLSAGASVGLGHVFFDVAAGGAAGAKAVNITAFPFTSLSDPSGANIPVDTASAGTITILSAATPEPSTLALMLVALSMLGAARCVRRQA